MDCPTVYFIQAEPPFGPVKIGYTRRRVKDRMSEGQTFSSTPLRVLVETLGSRTEETNLHQILSSTRIQGEWFTYSQTLRELILYLIEGGNLKEWLESWSGT